MGSEADFLARSVYPCINALRFRVLGFRRAVPTVGRVVNISSDLWAKADKTLAKTFFVSPGK